MFTYAELRTEVLRLCGVPGSGDLVTTSRFLRSVNNAIKRFARLGLAHYDMQLEATLPAPVAVTFTRTDGFTLTDVSPTPTPLYHRDGVLDIGGVLYPVRGLVVVAAPAGNTMKVNPEVPAGSTSGTLYSGGLFFGCDHGLPIQIGDKFYTDWRIDGVQGIAAFENDTEANVLIERLEAGTSDCWRQSDQSILVAPLPSAATKLRVTLTRRPIHVSAYGTGTDEVDFPEDFEDALLAAAVYYYRYYSGDKDLRDALRIVEDYDAIMKDAHASLTCDKFKNIGGLRYKDQRGLNG